MISWGKNLTTGINCRFEAFVADGNKSKKIFLGNDIQINDSVHISALNSVTIGNNVLIASFVYISDNSHGIYKINNHLSTSPNIIPTKRSYFSEPVIIGNNVWIGEGVIIMPGVRIGNGAIIGAHASVNSDIPENCIAVGNPAKVIKKWDETNLIWQKV